MNVLHCAAKRNQVAVVEFLKSKCFPPYHVCEIVRNQVSKVRLQEERRGMNGVSESGAG